MATKTISISEEAYNLLKGVKGEDESFTEAIIKVTKKDPLSELVGVLTKKEADELRTHIKASRVATEERLKRTQARLAGLE